MKRELDKPKLSQARMFLTAVLRVAAIGIVLGLLASPPDEATARAVAELGAGEGQPDAEAKSRFLAIIVSALAIGGVMGLAAAYFL